CRTDPGASRKSRTGEVALLRRTHRDRGGPGPGHRDLNGRPLLDLRPRLALPAYRRRRRVMNHLRIARFFLGAFRSRRRIVLWQPSVGAGGTEGRTLDFSPTAAA